MKNEAGLEALSINAFRVTLPVGLVVDEVSLLTRKALATLKPFGLQLEAPAEIEAKVSEQSVAEFMNHKGIGGLKDIKVSILGGIVTVEATAKIIMDVRVTATCSLRVVDEQKLMVDLETVSVPGAMAKGMVEKELAKANPIFDLSELAPFARITSLEADNGFIVLTGSADWPQSP